MFTIKSKAKNGGIWSKGKLLKFTKGILETDDAVLAESCRKRGYTVTGEASFKFDGMTADQLKTYAAEKKIDIGNASSEKGIIKKIEEAEAK